MAAHTVEPGTECPEGHGEEWLMKWDGSRADYLCCVCQKFFDVEPRAKVLVGDDLRTDGGRVDRCRECGAELGAGYLCDGCDTVEGWE